MSLRVVPPASHPNSTSKSSTVASAPSAPGLPDRLRSQNGAGEQTSSSTDGSNEPGPELASTHPLEARLAQWRTTQDSLRAETLRRTFGIAEPVRRGMEAKMVAETEWRPACLGGASRVHADILAGRDWTCDWEDVFTGDPSRQVPDFHAELERSIRMG